MSDETRRLILARRARFVAATLAGAALSVATTNARADDASSDAATDADADTDGSIFVDAGVRDAEADPQPCLCVMAREGTDASVAPIAALLVAAAALVALRRRTKKNV